MQNETSGDDDLDCSNVVLDGTMVAISSLTITLGMFASFVNLVFLHSLVESTGYMGVRVRVLLANVTINALVRSLYFIGRGVYLLVAGKYGFERLAVQPLICAAIELPYAITSMCMITGMLLIGVERLVTLLKRRKSDGKQQQQTPDDADRVGLCIKLVLGLLWVHSLAIYGAMVAVKLAKDDTPHSLCYCFFPLITTFPATVMNNAYFGAQELLVLTVYVYIYAVSRRRLRRFSLRTVEHSLTERHGTWTNVRTTRTLLPATALHACIFLTVLMSTIPLYQRFMSKPSASALNSILITHLVSLADLIAHPLLCVRFNERFRSVIGQRWPRLSWLFGGQGVRVGVVTAAITTPNTNPFSTRRSTVSGAEDGNKSDRLSGTNLSITNGMAFPRQTLKTDVSGKKMIVDFRMDPGVHDAIVANIWTKYSPD